MLINPIINVYSRHINFITNRIRYIRESIQSYAKKEFINNCYKESIPRQEIQKP